MFNQQMFDDHIQAQIKRDNQLKTKFEAPRLIKAITTLAAQNKIDLTKLRHQYHLYTDDECIKLITEMPFRKVPQLVEDQNPVVPWHYIDDQIIQDSHLTFVLRTVLRNLKHEVK